MFTNSSNELKLCIYCTCLIVVYHYTSLHIKTDECHTHIWNSHNNLYVKMTHHIYQWYTHTYYIGAAVKSQALILQILTCSLLLFSFGIDRRPTLIDNLDCSLSSYLNIFQCSFSTIISSSCTNNYDASVTCCK